MSAPFEAPPREREAPASAGAPKGGVRRPGGLEIFTSLLLAPLVGQR